MTKPSPIAVVALCIVAVSILAFTINDQLTDRKNSFSSKSALSKNANIISPIVDRNPPHGEPGHRHDLPDGAPLPTAGAAETTAPIENNLSLPTPALQSSGENTANAVNPAHGQPGHVCSIPVGAPLSSAPESPNAASVNSSTTTPGKNPAHGQPGHRCDIAVGAPLNSAPASAAVATTTKNSTPASTKTTTVAPGLNPAHGQPGHRCDIAVGAPLNSPPSSNSPAAKTTSSAATTNQKLNPSIFPNYSFTNKDSANNATPQFQYDSTGAALNPAHGQPGHDCSIAVGKPLKK